LQLHNILQSS